MPKKKKTRKQKMLADLRHKVVKIESAQTVVQTLEEPKVEHKLQSPVKTIATSSYQYLYSDLFKTIVLTVSIIAGELVLSRLFA